MAHRPPVEVEAWKNFFLVFLEDVLGHHFLDEVRKMLGLPWLALVRLTAQPGKGVG